MAVTQQFMHTTQQAREFFDQWREFSVAVLKHHGLPTDCGYKRKTWLHGRPKGITQHYTAGVSWQGSVSWLSGTQNKNSSCHIIICDRASPYATELQAKYPLLKDFQVLSLLLTDLKKGTWHATWSNNMNVGIENRNAGILSGTQGNWRWWAAKFDHEKLGKLPINIDGVWLEPYTYGQIVANIVVGQYLHCLYQDEGGLDPVWCVPHSCIQEGKRDTHKAFPLQDWRDAVFNQVPWEGMPWLQAFNADPQYMQEYEEEMDDLFLQALEERQGLREDSDDDFTDEDHEEFVAMPEPSLQALIQEGNWKEELDSSRRALEKLCYHTGGQGPVLDPTTMQSTKMFQRMMGLARDGIPGDKETQPALYRRLKVFQLED